ncbi:cytosine permease [Arthrobacter livingstonensis]|uniref:Cytosine permease n=1 Tax=Arthrobacter livingstonensis TaxID=670078 RepID=A0A2V5LIA5_9MICC|nr:cytosine permease [Arthrobacter livingstonensis]PYI66550.1 cytosine permease [Arthrobacter livingstonensis]
MSRIQTVKKSGPVIERRSIDFVPHAERHGRPFGQFTLWFGANMQITAIVTGALAVIFGSDAFWGIIGLFIGNLLGGTVMALHAAQGPKLGMPQMISSRAQFGVFGAVIPLVLVIVMYLGFAATGAVLAGQAVEQIVPTGHPALGVIIFGILTVLVATLGYKYIHLLGRISTIVGILGFSYLAIQLFLKHDVGAVLGVGGFAFPTFLLAISLSAGWQLTYGPYVADYSRYLPANTPARRTFISCFSGSVLGSQWSMTLGALFAAIAMPKGHEFLDGQVAFVGELAGGGAIAVLMYIVIVVGKLTVNTLNAYGGYMTILTSVSAFTRQLRFAPWVRFAYVIGFITVSVIIAIFASDDFVSNFKNFVLLLLMVFIPWSSINLVDFYLTSKEKVDVPALYDPKGRYGAWNVPALLTYALGIVVQIPFLAQTMYTGPMTEVLGGADISWLVGLVVTAVVYYPVAKRFSHPPAEMVYPEDLDAAPVASAVSPTV